MYKEYCLKLTLAIYRVTARFPKDEPLKNKIREKANEVLVGLILANPCPSPLIKKKLLKDTEILDNYFQIAQNQNWVDSRNFLFLEKEYDRIKNRVEEADQTPQSSLSLAAGRMDKTDRVNRAYALLPRHKRILEILREKGKAQVHDFQKIFPEITKRTLRRDFEFLLHQNIIKRNGEKNNTFYKLAI